MEPIIYPIVPREMGEKVVNLQNVLQLFLKQKIIKVLLAPKSPTAEDLARLFKTLQSEISEKIYGKATTELVHIFQVQTNLGEGLKGIVEEKTARQMNDILRKLGELEDTNNNNSNNVIYSVSGTVLNTNGTALAGYIVEAFIITLTKDIFLGRAVTSKTGWYSVSYNNPLNNAPDIEVRVYSSANDSNISKSPVRYNASPEEAIDVFVNAEKEKQASEFNMIIEDVFLHLGDSRLGDLKEDEGNRNITYIANKTGWDSRVTAMLVSAHQLGEVLQIDPAHIYSFLRAGIPASEDAIKSLSSETAKKSIENAVRKNIIPDNNNIDKTLKTLENLSVDYLLNSKPFSSVSSMGELLDLRLNPDQKTIFAQTKKLVGDDNIKLWSMLAERGFSTDTISKLKLDGKLGYLTGRNAQLIKKVYDKFSLKNDVELVSSGLYKSSEWQNYAGW